MKKLVVVVTVFVAFMLSGTAMAGEMKPAAYLGGGISMPSGDFSDFWKMGFGGAGRFGLQISPAIEIGGTVAYSSVPFDDDNLCDYVESIAGPIADDVTFEGADITLLEFLADVKFLIQAGEEGAPFKPYLSGTVGMTNVSIDDFTYTYGSTSVTVEKAKSTELSFGLGAGFEYMFGPKTGLWVDGKYMIINTEGDSMNHMPIRAGLKFMFGGTE